MKLIIQNIFKLIGMKLIATLFLFAITGICTAQTTITNGGFELWGNTVPAGDTYTEPTNWYSNQSGSSIAALGAETCFKDAAKFHSGLYSVRVETISGPFSTVINGVVTTGVVDAPTLTKTDGYIGTVNFSTATDIRHMSFTGRPDSIVGWYQYTSGGAGEQGKLRAILHTGDYYDPETPTTSHPNPTANKIADALFLTPTSSVSTWTRFSIPFTYVSASAPAYIMINVTSSANQATTVTGSKLWLDDLQVIYSTTNVPNNTIKEQEVAVYSSGQTVHIEFINGNDQQSVFSVFDLSGRTVYTTSLRNNEVFTYTLPGAAPGIYVYQLKNADFCKTGKLVLR